MAETPRDEDERIEEQAPAVVSSEPAVVSSEMVEETAEAVRGFLEGERVGEAVRALLTLHPADQADVVLDAPGEAREALIEAMDAAAVAPVLEELAPEDAADVARLLAPEDVAHALDELAPAAAADILHALPSEQAEAALAGMAEAEEVIPLLQYPDETAGGLMSRAPGVRVEATAEMALDLLRLVASEERAEPNVVFVVDGEGRPVGYVSIRRIALARPRALVADLMRPLQASVETGADQEECARIVERYDLSELAVTDASGALVGAIDAEDLRDVAEAEASEDMFRMAGMGRERPLASFRRSARSRAPWLALNLATTFAAAGVISLFESTIARAAALAVFLPVVAGQGGIGGTQTLTLAVRGMALGEIGARRGRRLLAREAALGVFNGAFLGALVAVGAALWQRSPLLGLIVGLAMFGNMIVAGVVGAGVPLALRRLRQDPAVSSAVVVTTATDVMGFLLFLGLATLAIDRLA